MEGIFHHTLALGTFFGAERVLGGHLGRSHFFGYGPSGYLAGT